VSLHAAIGKVLLDAFDSAPRRGMRCPYCGVKARRVGGPLYYWKCPGCAAFGTTWEWEQAHRANQIRAGERYETTALLKERQGAGAEMHRG